MAVCMQQYLAMSTANGAAAPSVDDDEDEENKDDG